MTMTKRLKKQKLRNAEYYDFQPTLDNSYKQSKENKLFASLVEIVLQEENILLAYRNIRKNKGSKTEVTDGRTIRYLSKFTDENLIKYVRKRLEHYIPRPVRRVESGSCRNRIPPNGVRRKAESYHRYFLILC